MNATKYYGKLSFVCWAEKFNLFLLITSQAVSESAELLSADETEEILEAVKNEFDYVIIDTPPVNIVTDASVIAGKITGYVLVVQSGKNHLQDINDAVHQINEMKGTIVGMVLNDPFNRAEAHYSYMYKKYYRYDKYKYYGEKSSTKR